jgi:hypothetical protein
MDDQEDDGDLYVPSITFFRIHSSTITTMWWESYFTDILLNDPFQRSRLARYSCVYS